MRGVEALGVMLDGDTLRTHANTTLDPLGMVGPSRPQIRAMGPSQGYKLLFTTPAAAEHSETPIARKTSSSRRRARSIL